MTTHRLSPILAVTDPKHGVTFPAFGNPEADEWIDVDEVQQITPQPYSGKAFVLMKNGVDYLTTWEAAAEVENLMNKPEPEPSMTWLDRLKKWWKNVTQ